jgi:hypothetical protein
MSARMSSQGRHLATTLLATIVLAACGPAVDEPSDGAGSTAETSTGVATDASSTAEPADGSTAGDASSESGAPEQTPCELYCSVASQCSPGAIDCIASCEQGRPEECGAEFDALVPCRTPFLAVDCMSEGICLEEQAAFDACLETASPTECYTSGMSVLATSCTGEGSCLNGQQATMICDTADDGTIHCECLVDDVLLGECTDAVLACDLASGCCGELY